MPMVGAAARKRKGLYLSSLCLWTMVGCAHFLAPEPIDDGQVCYTREVKVQIERGMDFDCQIVAQKLTDLRDVYERRFGRMDLTGFTIRLVKRITTFTPPDGATVVGFSYLDNRTIDVITVWALPHELHHFKRGAGHVGWCEDFGPFSREVLHWDEDAYLGCTEPTTPSGPQGH